MVMVDAQVTVALTTVQSHFADDLRITLFRGKAPVCILYIPSADNDIPGDLDKVPVIAAVGAYYPANGLTRRKLNFFHL